ncbi:MAG: hypothetical protein U1E06_08470 [Tabrizicola sp.]|nr:hypothetical protein [Tabrizicola sp.]
MTEVVSDNGFHPMFARAHPLTEEQVAELYRLLGTEPGNRAHFELEVAISGFVENAIERVKHGPMCSAIRHRLKGIAKGDFTVLDVPSGATTVVEATLRSVIRPPVRDEPRDILRWDSEARAVAANLEPSVRAGRRGVQPDEPLDIFLLTLLDIVADAGAGIGLGSNQLLDDKEPPPTVAFVAEVLILAADRGLAVIAHRVDGPENWQEEAGSYFATLKGKSDRSIVDAIRLAAEHEIQACQR